MSAEPVPVDGIPPARTSAADRWAPIFDRLQPGETVSIEHSGRYSAKCATKSARRFAVRRALDVTVAVRGVTVYIRRNT